MTWTQEKQQAAIEHVLDELGKGRSLTKILEEDANLPSRKEWYRWERELEELRHEVAHARELGAASLLEEIVDIANRVRPDSEHVAKAKLQVYAREKYAQMIAPRRFGAKVDVTSGGEKLPPPAAPIQVEAQIVSLLTKVMNREPIDDETRGLLE